MKKSLLFFVLFVIGMVSASAVFAYVDDKPLPPEKCVTPQMIDETWGRIRLREVIQNSQGRTAEINKELAFLRGRLTELSARFSTQRQCEGSHSIQQPAVSEKAGHVATEIRQSFSHFLGEVRVGSFGAGAGVIGTVIFLFVRRKCKQVRGQKETRRVLQALQVLEHENRMREFVRKYCTIQYANCPIRITPREIQLELLIMRFEELKAARATG